MCLIGCPALFPNLGYFGVHYGERISEMPAGALIETHIDEAVRLKAEAAFATASLTIDQAIHRLLLRCRTADRSSGTLRAQCGDSGSDGRARAGGGKSFHSVAELMADL
jgi:hypothetical protein